jgi:nitrate reductase gamma subunit
VRFDREQYTWKSDSSQLLRRGQLRWGSNLFHVGILLLFLGHLVGLLAPHSVVAGMGMSNEAHQLLAMGAGALFGTMCLVGLILLVHRRIAIARIRATSTRMDIFILLWILATLLLGLTTILFSARHPDGSMMILLSEWAQHIVTFRGGAAAFVAGVPLVYKIHLFFGLTLFFLFPFSRLVHVWSGFASIAYLGRAYQIVRSRG